MQFLSISRRLTERFGDEEFARHVDAERERVREMYRDGIVRAIWSRKDVAGAVMLLECADEAAAREAVGSLPLAQRDMLEVQILPLGPYPAFLPQK
ncbi:MAG TPA: muconolactone Delta-isomerase family protein [Candidatus Baltobacteraceae bacterium]|jgi:muconolactone delta-isomerase|nr:muconolactone Delta-isomerase family protein [Candidatus Baltobacteraceae bacterium]